MIFVIVGAACIYFEVGILWDLSRKSLHTPSTAALPTLTSVIPLYTGCTIKYKQLLCLEKDPVWTVVFICSVDVLVSKFDFSPKEYPLRMP